MVQTLKYVQWQVAVVQQKARRFRLLERHCSVKVIHNLISGSRVQESIQLGITYEVSGDNKWCWGFYHKQTDSAWVQMQTLCCSEGRLNPSHWQCRLLAWGFPCTCGWHERERERQRKAIISGQRIQKNDQKRKKTWTRKKGPWHILAQNNRRIIKFKNSWINGLYKNHTSAWNSYGKNTNKFKLCVFRWQTW